MKKIAFYLVGLGMFLSGCDYQAGGDWRDDCKVHSSYDSYEYARCIDRVTQKAESGMTPETSAPSAVTIDSGNANRPGREDLGKGDFSKD